MFNPRRLHPMSIVLNLIRLVRHSFFLLLLVYLGSRNLGLDDIFPYLPALLVAVILLFIIVGAILHWWRFVYYVYEGELRIEYGLILRKRRFIPQERIQAINLTAGIFHRPFNLVKVEIDTASGGTEDETALIAITRSEAEALQKVLIRNESDGQSEQELDERTDGDGEFVERTDVGAELSRGTLTSVPLAQYQLPTKELLLAAMTSGSFGVLFSLLAAGLTQIEQLFPDLEWYALVAGYVKSNLMVLIYLIPLLALFSWLLAVVITSIKYAHFTLIRYEDEVYVSYGLLEKREYRIPLHRIQAITIIENPVRQLLGRTSLYIESAGSNLEEGGSRMLFPLLHRKQLKPLLKQVAPFEWQLDHHWPEENDWQTLPRRAFLRYALRLNLPVILVIILTAIWLPYGFLSPFLLVLTLPFAYLQYKAGGWRQSGSMLMLRYRFFSKVTVFIPKRAIQAAHVNQSIFQRRGRLVTIGASIMSGIAGAFFKVRDVEETDGDHLLDWSQPVRK